MKKRFCILIAGMVLATAGRGLTAVRYVDVNSASPTPPYTSWATAAAIIQQAVDAATAGDDIVVTNGIYASGGRAVSGTMTNRVAVTKALTLRSVNGPQATIILGWQVPGITNGDGAIRCVYLSNGASLFGFTLTNGATRAVNDAPTESNGGGLWCESAMALVSNCVMVVNSASNGGGGAYGGTLNNCTLSGNAASIGGGAAGGDFRGAGGDFVICTLNNCALSGNSASFGGGAYVCTLNNCTLSGNSASREGGGAWDCILNNCIIYFNTADRSANYLGSTLHYSCTTPLPPDGVGNISVDPQLASAWHLNSASPCRGAGSTAYTIGTDIDGDAWNTPPSIGCDEYHPGGLTGPLSVSTTASLTNVAVDYPVVFTPLIDGHVTASAWDFGDGQIRNNQPYVTHAWATPGDYAVVLSAYNETLAGGISTTATAHVVTQPIHYVAAEGRNPVTPYTSWATAATKIQDGVDAATMPGAQVLVTNGIYATGGRGVTDMFGQVTSNRVNVDKPLTLQSVNGPQFTVIQGQPPFVNTEVRCVYLIGGASLSGFTLTNGVVSFGAGVWCQSDTAVVSNCVIVGNSAPDLNGHGGGAYGGTLNNCTLTGNYAGGDFIGGGGGANWSTLNNCTLTGNSAPIGGGGGAFHCTLNNCSLAGNSANGDTGHGGGAAASVLNNCIVYFNTATHDANSSGCTLNYCCTTPAPSADFDNTDGFGNITNTPLFLSRTSGNLRLQTNSSCINAGKNFYAAGSTDLDGNPRIAGGTVDIGAYEFQNPASLISYAWLQQYGLPMDGSADTTDPDADGLNNWQEWRCRTNPTNALSALRLLVPGIGGNDDTVTWQSVAGVKYFLERAINLGESPGFTLLATNLAGQAGTTTYVTPQPIVRGQLFYRVGVEK